MKYYHNMDLVHPVYMSCKNDVHLYNLYLFGYHGYDIVNNVPDERKMLQLDYDSIIAHNRYDI